jgi:hypothetical protein
MRTDWIPLSASALVIGVMALVFGSLLNPAPPDATTAETMRQITVAGGRWLGMSVMYFVASVAMTLGLPALLSLFVTRGRRIGVLAVGVFTVGVIGTCGYAMLLVFFRALVNARAVDDANMQAVTEDAGLSFLLAVWIGGFYLGLLLVAVALFVARRTPVWVPGLIVVFVALFPVAAHIGRVGQVLQVMALAVAFTGVAVAAVNDVHARRAARQPAY